MIYSTDNILGVQPVRLRSTYPKRRRSAPLSREFLIGLHDALCFWDFVAVAYSGIVSWHAITRTSDLPANATTLAHYLAFVGAMVALFLLYKPWRERLSPQSEPARGRLWSALRFALLAGILGLLVAPVQLVYPPAAIAVAFWGVAWAGVSIPFLTAGRELAKAYVGEQTANRRLKENVAIIGSGDSASRLANRLSASTNSGINVVGVFGDRRSRLDADQIAPIGGVRDLVELGKKEEIDWIIMTLPSDATERIASIVHELKALDARIAVCPEQILKSPDVTAIEHIDTIPVGLLVDRPIVGRSRLLKRVMDIVISIIVILFILPILITAAILIKIDSPGPIFYLQKRHGLNNADFKIYKFRTMRWEGGGGGPLRQTSRNDGRVTRIGAFLRKSSIDELPQLFNVLKGDMSLVGPRPHAITMQTEDKYCWEIVAEYCHRHRVRPGMTGLAQVNGFRGATENSDALSKRIEFDLFYIENWSILMDLQILFRTAFLVAGAKNAF